MHTNTENIDWMFLFKIRARIKYTKKHRYAAGIYKKKVDWEKNYFEDEKSVPTTTKRNISTSSLTIYEKENTNDKWRWLDCIYFFYNSCCFLYFLAASVASSAASLAFLVDLLLASSAVSLTDSTAFSAAFRPAFNASLALSFVSS